MILFFNILLFNILFAYAEILLVNDIRRPVGNLAKNISNLYGQRVNVMQPQLVAQPRINNTVMKSNNVISRSNNAISRSNNAISRSNKNNIVQPYMNYNKMIRNNGTANNMNYNRMIQPAQRLKISNNVGKINYPGGLNNIKIQPLTTNNTGNKGKENNDVLGGLQDLINKLKKQTTTKNEPVEPELSDSNKLPDSNKSELDNIKPELDTTKLEPELSDNVKLDGVKPVEIEPFDLETSTPEIDESIFDKDINKDKQIDKDSDLQEIIKPAKNKRIRKKRESTIPDRSIKKSTTSVSKASIDNINKQPKDNITSVNKQPIDNIKKSQSMDNTVTFNTSTTTKTVTKTVSSSDENSTDFINPKRSKLFLKKHNTDILSADKARKSYIDYKILESKDRQLEIEKKLNSLEEIRERVQLKLSGIRDERDSLKMKIEKMRSREEDESKAVKNLEEEIEKSEGQIKLEQMEISKLEKALSEEKSKYSIMVEQQKVFKNRIERSEKRGAEVELNEKKLEDYENLLKGIEKDFERLKKKIEEVEERRKNEIANQNRLEVERKEIEDSGHIPLFAIYD